jgi:hypothetical protein
VIHGAVYYLLARVAGRPSNHVDDSLVSHSRGPARLLVPLILLSTVLPGLGLETGALGVVNHAISLIFIAAIAWLLLRMLRVFEDVIVARYDLDSSPDGPEGRKVLTQLSVFKKIATSLVLVLAVSVMMMSADDSLAAWMLGCEVREVLLARIRERFPEALPKVRAAVHSCLGADRAASDR